MRDLAGVDATLVGTVPLGIDVPGSDLDIICRARVPDAFERELRRLYGSAAGFRLDRRAGPTGRARSLGRFTAGGEQLEIFGEDVPVEEQAGFCHMVVEARLLELGGDALRRRVVERKRAGERTEPAFAAELRLDGDADERIHALHHATDEVLADLIRRAAGPA